MGTQSSLYKQKPKKLYTPYAHFNLKMECQHLSRGRRMVEMSKSLNCVKSNQFCLEGVSANNESRLSPSSSRDKDCAQSNMCSFQKGRKSNLSNPIPSTDSLEHSAALPSDLLDVSLIEDLNISLTTVAQGNLDESFPDFPDQPQAEDKQDPRVTQPDNLSQPPKNAFPGGAHPAPASTSREISIPDVPRDTQLTDLPQLPAEDDLTGSKLRLVQPEDFTVEGLPRSIDKETTKTCRKRKRDERKTNRNLGLAYISTSNVVVPDRRQLSERCDGKECQRRQLRCHEILDSHRLSMLSSYWDMGNLQEQRNWIARHISTNDLPESTGKRKRTVDYFLPVESQRLRVCRKMFLNTVNVSEKFVRNVISKIGDNGILQGDQRGGDSKADINAAKRQCVLRHIARFPRVESHYCRSSTTCEYVSSDLTVTKMYELYKESPEGVNCPVSYERYRGVLANQNIKFHNPKKDTCGICESKRNSTETAGHEVEEAYSAHIREKQAARDALGMWRTEAKEDHHTHLAIFDLQKVLCLPKSNRGEIFYKRRLSCFNFTIFDVGKGQGHCYFWYETVAGRGANEIASCLYHYLQQLDNANANRVGFFSDGCAGQNKNSIVPTMIRHFLKSSTSVKTVRLNYFETNHGQSEGDSIHSVIESAVNRVENISVPSELVGIIKLAAKKKPYRDTEIQTADIKDFKSAAAASGILRVRSSDQGSRLAWPDFMQIELNKNELEKISFKTSHLQDVFETISMPARRNLEAPPRAVESAFKLSAGKYADLASLCNGATPVISIPAHKDFYLSLPHN